MIFVKFEGIISVTAYWKHLHGQYFQYAVHEITRG